MIQRPGRNDIDADEEERTTAIGLARYAREFHEAALGADARVGRRPGYEIHAPAPVMFLIAHSIELALKSYLRHVGFDLASTKAFGHDLEKLWSACSEQGIAHHVAMTAPDRNVLVLISSLHRSTELRYIRTGAKTWPVFGPLQELNSKLLDAICPLVGYR